MTFGCRAGDPSVSSSPSQCIQTAPTFISAANDKNMTNNIAMILYPFFLVILGKIHGICQKYLLMLFNILAGTGPPVESKILSGRRYESPFSVEELLNLVIPKKQSKDDYMDPCKAPAFIGKICFCRRVCTVHSFNLQVTLHIPRVQCLQSSTRLSRRARDGCVTTLM